MEQGDSAARAAIVTAADERSVSRTLTSEVARRRTFAVISHPDAGKSTLTEALALHARVIGEAGAVHGKGNRRGVVSDWMDMERARGISITSAALQFSYRDHVINLLDTPGHADFSEDTYRVLAAVDAAVMLVDAAKGLEPQTMKLFDVCRHRGIPVITVVNKWDRPGPRALALMTRSATDRLWSPPADLAGRHRRGLPRGARPPGTGDFIRLHPDRRRRTLPAEERWTRPRAAPPRATRGPRSRSTSCSSEGRCTSSAFLGRRHHAGAVRLGGAQLRRRQLLERAVARRPRRPPADAAGEPRTLGSPFSGFVFKVQAGMDTSHRDRLAFVRVCSGVFERGMVVTHASTGRPFATKYAQTVFGRERTTVDLAYPGDVVGLVNASTLRAGDTLYADAPVEFPPIPYFAPEHFAVVRARDTGRYKQFRRGIEQLEQEGVVQVLRSDRRGDQAPVLAAVGPMQFEVCTDRMAGEFAAPVTLESLPYGIARRTDAESTELLNAQPGCEVLRRSDGELLALFADKWRLGNIQRNHPGVLLEPLVAAAD
jgi:peptide chain release factor 3